MKMKDETYHKCDKCNRFILEKELYILNGYITKNGESVVDHLGYTFCEICFNGLLKSYDKWIANVDKRLGKKVKDNETD